VWGGGGEGGGGDGGSGNGGGEGGGGEGVGGTGGGGVGGAGEKGGCDGGGEGGRLQRATAPASVQLLNHLPSKTARTLPVIGSTWTIFIKETVSFFPPVTYSWLGAVKPYQFVYSGRSRACHIHLPDMKGSTRPIQHTRRLHTSNARALSISESMRASPLVPQYSSALKKSGMMLGDR
jgi:hypothetical protein